jgi:hypothetical protein
MAMATIDDRFDALEKMMKAGFQDMRTELRAELGSELRSGLQELRTTMGTELRTEMRAGFQAMNKRFDSLSMDFADFRRDLGSRIESLGHYVHLTDQGYFKMGDRLFSLEQRVDQLESAASPFNSQS